jgi:hypothetical protein
LGKDYRVVIFSSVIHLNATYHQIIIEAFGNESIILIGHAYGAFLMFFVKSSSGFFALLKFFLKNLNSFKLKIILG